MARRQTHHREPLRTTVQVLLLEALDGGNIPIKQQQQQQQQQENKLL